MILHEEFLKRVKSRKLLEALILVGAFDHFGKNRATLLQTIDQVLDTASDVEQDDMLFDILTRNKLMKIKKSYLIKCLVIMKRVFRLLHI